MALLGFLLLLPFFALLVWLALIARVQSRTLVLQQSALCLALSALTSALAYEQASSPIFNLGYPIWPHIVAAMVAFSVFLLLGSVAYLRLPKSASKQ